MNHSELKLVKSLIKLIIKESYGGGAAATDPTDAKGFYDYDIERGTDLYSYWYASPGRSEGSDGDPGRPSDAKDYLGMNSLSDDPSSDNGEPIEFGDDESI